MSCRIATRRNHGRSPSLIDPTSTRHERPISGRSGLSLGGGAPKSDFADPCCDHQGVERTDQGSFVVSAEEMRVLRQGLFVTLHHGDEEIRHNVQTITGYEPDEFRQLMWAVDEINGHNDEIRQLLDGQLAELAALPASEIEKRSRRVTEVVDAAERYGLDVPLNLRSTGGPSRG